MKTLYVLQCKAAPHDLFDRFNELVGHSGRKKNAEWKISGSEYHEISLFRYHQSCFSLLFSSLVISPFLFASQLSCSRRRGREWETPPPAPRQSGNLLPHNRTAHVGGGGWFFSLSFSSFLSFPLLSFFPLPCRYSSDVPECRFL